ncbi:hypothetical protein Q0S63_15710, partial [Escherichia coli O175:H26]
STSKTPSYTKSVSWQHHQMRKAAMDRNYLASVLAGSGLS